MIIMLKQQKQRMKKNSYTIIDSYKDYKEEYKNTPFLVDKETYKNICYDFNKAVSEDMIKNTLEFDIPSRLGSIRIKKIKGKNDLKSKKIDWKASKESGMKIYHLNMHTDGYHYKWHWHKQDALFANKSIYSFRPTRFNKRTLAGLLKLNEIDFFE